jgi:putative molybdopterin biosynthesis protein
MTRPLTNSLAEVRSERGWSQSQAAAAGGISRQSYAAIESGRAVPSTEVALRLSAAFGRPVEQLFQLREDATARIRAVWSGRGSPLGRRVRIARVGERTLAFGVGEVERPFRRADGIVTASDGETVEVLPLPDRPPEPDLVAVGCDPAFGVVEEMVSQGRRIEICWLQRGSRHALESLARGEAHIAGAHLRDPVTGGYNKAWIDRLVPFACTRVRFADWEQGLLVSPGNPLDIETVEDLVRPDLRFLNREEGSGSRALLDEQLRAADIAPQEVPGYDTGAPGHMAVAEAIAAGLADVGVGIEAAGRAFGLDVLPLQTESYELVIPNHFLHLAAVQILLDTLRMPGTRAQIEALGGYDGARMGQGI